MSLFSPPKLILGDELEYDLPGYGHVEGPRLLPGGDDLLRGEELPIVARVPQLHPVAGMAVCQWLVM